MKKVLCIDAKTPNRGGLIPYEIEEGKVYTVTEECITPKYKEPSYFLAECEYSYGRFRFIPLSDIDEKELVNQREEECIS